MFYLRKVNSKNLKVVVIGGGTGLSTLLRGLKLYTKNITAIVTVADDGGGSGILRQDLGMLPPGDIRNCILALAETEPIMERLLLYRFTEGSLAGQNFGNLFLAAMDGISENFVEAVQNVSDVLRVTGRVLPVTLCDVALQATLTNGDVIEGESNIGHSLDDKDCKIKEVCLVPNDAQPLPEVLQAIHEADVIVLGPGSLYTSIIPNLLVKGVPDAISQSKAVKIYVCNLMTQPGESDDMTAFEHVSAIFNHSNRDLIQYCIANRQRIPDDLLEKYTSDGAKPVEVNQARFKFEGIQLIEGDFLKIHNGLVRHDYDKLAKAVMDIAYHKNKR